MVHLAIDGKLGNFREVADRVDPKPRRIEISGRDGVPIETAEKTARDLSPADAADAYRIRARQKHVECGRIKGAGRCCHHQSPSLGWRFERS